MVENSNCIYFTIKMIGKQGALYNKVFSHLGIIQCTLLAEILVPADGEDYG